MSAAVKNCCVCIAIRGGKHLLFMSVRAKRKVIEVIDCDDDLEDFQPKKLKAEPKEQINNTPITCEAPKINPYALSSTENTTSIPPTQTHFVSVCLVCDLPLYHLSMQVIIFSSPWTFTITRGRAPHKCESRREILGKLVISTDLTHSSRRRVNSTWLRAWTNPACGTMNYALRVTSLISQRIVTPQWHLSHRALHRTHLSRVLSCPKVSRSPLVSYVPCSPRSLRGSKLILRRILLWHVLTVPYTPRLDLPTPRLN